MLHQQAPQVRDLGDEALNIQATVDMRALQAIVLQGPLIVVPGSSW